MTIPERIAKAIDRFDEAARVWGWQEDQGSDGGVIASAFEEYQFARADLEAAILAAEQRGAASSQQTEPGRRVRHLKRGSEYSVVAHGRLQVDGDLDNEKVTVYRGDDGQVWVRPDYEFNDGRFEDIGPAASPSPAPDSTRVDANETSRSIAIGMAMAAGIIMACWGDDTRARQILSAAGFNSVQDLIDGGVDEYDINLLRPALQSTDQKGDGHE